MILGLITKPITIAVDVILAFIPKKILILLIIALLFAIYYGFNYNF